MSQSYASALAGLFLGAGIALAGFFGSNTLLNKEKGLNTAEVKGLSERVLPADDATWALQVSVRENNLGSYAGAFAEAQRNMDRVVSLLTAQGISENEISIIPLRRQDRTIRNNQSEVVESYFTVSGSIVVHTTEPNKIATARGPALALGAEGINIVEDRLEYSFSSLNDIKPDMLREATANARIAANEFATNAGVKVGGIQYARQGGFEIYPDEANPVQQHIRVVTNISFYLDN